MNKSRSSQKRIAQLRLEKLKLQIDEYRYRYHVLDDPAVSDEIYDSLTRELSGIEKDFPELITADSPTQRVGGEPLKKFISVAHIQPMLSLNDVFSEDDLMAWITRTEKLLPKNYKPEYHLDIKMDGLAAAVVYEAGKLVRGLTRGDGIRGEDVTSNLRTISTIPLILRRDKTLPKEFYTGRVEVRGEVIMYKKDFEAINAKRREEGLVEYANPRNFSAGSIRQLDPKLTASRPLRFHAYSVIVEPPLATHVDEYKTAQKLGFVVNSQHHLVNTANEIIDFVEQWEEKRHDLSYQSDGLVITLNDRKTFAELGVAGKAPRGAVAYKYPAEQATTRLKDILVSIGRTGAATPFAVLEPVRIAGSTVQMATLHNEGEVHRKDVRIGDTVVVQKAGDIIPEVVEPLPKLRDGHEKKFVMPKTCPVCDTILKKEKKEEAIWRCPNKNCPARVRGQIIHFGSKQALDIEGLGEKNVEALLKAGLISDPADLYELKASDIEKLDRFARKSAENLVDAIADKKTPPLDRFIFGLGIRHIGRQTAIDLSRHYKDLDLLASAQVEELEKLEGIGSVVAESIVLWFSSPRNQKLLQKFDKVGVKPSQLKTSDKLNGKSFVITGALQQVSRDEAAEKVRALGGKFQSSVSKDTDYLVVGEKPGSSKIKDADKYMTTRLTESEFLKLI